MPRLDEYFVRGVPGRSMQYKIALLQAVDHNPCIFRAIASAKSANNLVVHVG